MIQRRRPIESAIAERKMFNMGGMAVPMPQPTYMDLTQQGIMGMPQQPMGMPQQAQGIMASSQPLVDAIAADAANPAGGDTLSMAQGGAVGFANGGLYKFPDLGGSVSNSTTVPSPIRAGLDIYRARNESDAERLQSIFPESAQSSLTDMEPTGISKAPYALGRGLGYAAGALGNIPGRAGTALGKAVEGAKGALSATSGFVDDWLGKALRGDMSRLQYWFSDDEETSGRSMAERVVLTNMIDRRPDLANEIMEAGVRYSAKGLDDKTFAEQIARDLSIRYESGNVLKAAGIDPLDPDATSDDQTFNKIEPGRSPEPVLPGDEEAFYTEDLSNKIEEYRIAMGQGPGAQMQFAQNLAIDPNYTQEFKDAVLQSADAGPPVNVEPPEGIVPSADGVAVSPADGVAVPSADGAKPPKVRTAPLPPTRPGAGPAEAAGTSPSDGGPQGPDKVIGDYNTAAAHVASILDTDKKAGSKDIATFKKEFMEAMPKYEGMSEDEKGFLIAEAGLRIMAGKSPNAIENIAKGLQGLGPALMKGEKEKRAWKRQVELSAAKYALEGVAKADTKAEALAKEGRGLKTVFWTEDVFGPDGKLRGKSGTSGFITNEEIHSGQYDGRFEAGLTLASERLKNKTSGTAKILRRMIGQTKKGGPSDQYFDKKLKEYTSSSLKLSDYATQLALVDVSAAINEQGEATGLGSYVSRRVNEFYNAFNVGRPSEKKIKSVKDLTSKDIDKLKVSNSRKDRLKSIKSGYSTLDKLAARGRSSEQFFAQQQELANLLIKEILGEGSKNISNIDRKLAAEIVGLYSGVSSITADKVIIGQRLGRIRKRILKNYETENNTMSSTEAFFTNIIDRNYRDVRKTYFTPVRRSALSQVESALGQPRRDRPAAIPPSLGMSSPYIFKTINGKRTYSFK